MVVAFPAPRVIPFEEFPSSAAVPHHCGRCPLAFAARSPRPDLPDLVVELSTRVPSAEASGSSLAPARAEALAGTAPPLAEAVGGACSTAGRSRWWCSRPRWPKPSWTLLPLVACASCGGFASPPKRAANRSGLRRLDGRRPSPEGPGAPPATEVRVVSTGHRGGAMVAESRGSALVMLRSAEADPHVTKRASSRPASRTTPPPVPLVAPPPEGVGLSCGGTSLQSGRGHAEPRRPKPRGSTSPPHRCIWHLRRRPLPGFAVNAAPVEQLTSGLYSADESVETHRRFQRCVTRVSHGLGSPSRSC
jgi:hypothetical protein